VISRRGTLRSAVMPRRRGQGSKAALADRNSAVAEARSEAAKSGHITGVNTSSAYAHSQSIKSLNRCSPPVRISRSTSGAPSASESASRVASLGAPKRRPGSRRARNSRQPDGGAAFSPRGGALAFVDHRKQQAGQAIAPSDHRHTHALSTHWPARGADSMKHLHQRGYFGLRPAPVVRRKCIDRQHGDPEIGAASTVRARPRRRPDVRPPAATLAWRPAPVSVHDDAACRPSKCFVT